jgi:hypothetical protein
MGRKISCASWKPSGSRSSRSASVSPTYTGMVSQMNSASMPWSFSWTTFGWLIVASITSSRSTLRPA